MQYAAPGAPKLAVDVRKLLHRVGQPVQDVPERGLDRGACVPLGAVQAELGIQRSIVDGFWLGLSKRSVQLG